MDDHEHDPDSERWLAWATGADEVIDQAAEDARLERLYAREAVPTSDGESLSLFERRRG